jgi:type II secretory pathway pseudopilin PulG
MSCKITNKRTGFTMIELMVSIFITLTVVGTFFKLYTNSVKTQRSTAVRASVNILGEQMMETLASSIRLLGLTSDNLDYQPAGGNPGTVILDANGSAGGTDSASFRYISPYGGPVTKLSIAATGTDGACTLTLINSSSLYAGMGTVNIVSNVGIHQATVASINGNVIVTSAMTPAIAGACSVFFPQGTLLTGPNNDFQLTYVNSGSDTQLSLISTLPSGATDTYVNFNSNNNPLYQMPYFVLQFLREFDDGTGMIRREWFSNIDEDVSPADLQQVRAIRIGFVLLSDADRIKKKVASADAGITTQFCPFDLMCYSLTDQNKTAYVFRRVIHIKNYDYLAINAGVNKR